MTTETETKTEEEPATKPAPAADTAAEAEKWKAMARKHEAEAKKNADAAKELAALKDADKSENQKLVEAAAVEKQRADDAEARALRLEVAADKGLTPAQAKRLQGTTREEMESDADELLDAFKPSDTGGDKGGDKQPVPGKPKEQLRSGGDPTQEPVETDPTKLAAAISRGF